MDPVNAHQIVYVVNVVSGVNVAEVVELVEIVSMQQVVEVVNRGDLGKVVKEKKTADWVNVVIGTTLVEVGNTVETSECSERSECDKWGVKWLEWCTEWIKVTQWMMRMNGVNAV